MKEIEVYMELREWQEMTCILIIIVIILVITFVFDFRELDKNNTKVLEKINNDKKLIRVKFEIGQVVYIFKDNRIYKDKIKEIKVNKQGKKYTGIILKDIDEKYIYATFDDLCNDNKLNKDDILMYAYNNDIDKKERRIEC
jgi:glucose uptake protein GlcU